MLLERRRDGGGGAARGGRLGKAFCILSFSQAFQTSWRAFGVLRAAVAFSAVTWWHSPLAFDPVYGAASPRLFCAYYLSR